MKNLIINFGFIITCLWGNIAPAQSLKWTAITKEKIQFGKEKAAIKVRAGQYLNLDFDQAISYLSPAPDEQKRNLGEYGLKVQLPMPDGSFRTFAVAQYHQMPLELERKYPEIKTFMGQSLEGSMEAMLDYGPKGFHGQIFTREGTVYIDPVFQNQTDLYVSYFKSDLIRESHAPFSCGQTEEEEKEEIKRQTKEKNRKGGPTAPLGSTGPDKRTYRIAIAATGEYVSFHGGTKSMAMAAINTALARVNGVYNRELTIRFTLVAQNDTLVFTDSILDPYTNSNPLTMLAQNQITCDARIGEANYDIGHVFGTGSGGFGPGLTCKGGEKAKGVTGRAAPVGDPFYIDYVCHEIGHQFTALHSFNGSGCSAGTRTSGNTVEPGSGITIMGYAGICGSDNLALNSIEYFHSHSLNQIISYSQTGDGNTCGQSDATFNTAPVVSIVSPLGKTIPKLTPYRLSGSATDADPNLTFSWEQDDKGSLAEPPSTSSSSDGPLTRSFSPTTQGYIRTVPRMEEILADSTLKGNVLGSVSRNMNFVLTARDNNPNGGGIGQANYQFMVTATAGPFKVAYPNKIQDVLRVNQEITIRWDVANTQNPPVSCSKVSIKLSRDGGWTYPVVLADSTPNDGEFKVLLPESSGSNRCRIKIESIGNIFFDVSDSNFVIKKHCAVLSQCNPQGTGPRVHIKKVELGKLEDTSGCSETGYRYSTKTGTLLAGRSYSIKVYLEPATQLSSVGVWIDGNNDMDFNDFSEFKLNTFLVQGVGQGEVFIADDSAQMGQRRLRIRAAAGQPTFQSMGCDTSLQVGETEDYDITLKDYCKPKLNCSQLGISQITIQSCTTFCYNSPGCSLNGYRLISTQEARARIPLGSNRTFDIEISGGNAYMGAFVDFNDDADFDDPGEFVAGSDNLVSNGSWSFDLSIPAQASLIGLHRFRIICNRTVPVTSFEPCGPFQEGEVVDGYIDLFYSATISSSSQTSLCTGQTFQITVQQEGQIPPGEVLKVFLSDSAGGFSNQIQIGQGIPPTIACTIPPHLSPGFQYHLALRNSNLGVDDYDLTNYLLFRTPIVNQINPTSGRPGDTLTITGQNLDQVGFIEFSGGGGGSFPLTQAPDGSQITLVIPQFVASGPLILNSNCNVITQPISILPPCSLSIFSINSDVETAPGCENGSVVVVGQGTDLPSAIATLYSFPGMLQLATKIFFSSDAVVFEGLPAGDYRVKLQNIDCQTELAEVTVGVGSCHINLQQDSISQVGEVPGKLFYSVLAPACMPRKGFLKRFDGFQFVNIPFNPILGPGENDFILSDLAAGTYRLVYRQISNLCADSLEFQIEGSPGQVLTPVIFPGSGQFTTLQLVSMASQTPGAQIYFTTNGNTPRFDVPNSFTRLYSQPFLVGTTTTIRAIARKSGMTDSPQNVALLFFPHPLLAETVVASPLAGTYPTGQFVSLTSSTPDAQLYFTLNGNTPIVGTSFTQLYTSPIFINANQTLKAIAVKAGLLNSPVFTAIYSILNPTPRAATPIIFPPSGIYANPLVVTMQSSTPGATIYYTTNGNSPRLDVPNFFTKVYTAPFVISAPTTLRALATAPGFLTSGTTVSFFTFGGSRMALSDSGQSEELENFGQMASLYPNPSLGRFFLRLSSEGSREFTVLEVFSPNGKQIMEMPISEGKLEYEIRLEHFPPGIYLLKMHGFEKLSTIRMVKQ